jgi:hypothetical protein
VLYLIVYIYVSANKKSIIKQVTEEIGEKLNGDVTIGNIELSFFTNFPRISVLMEKVSIKDSMFEKHKHAFLQADEISLLLNVKKLINKQAPLSGITVNNANVYLYTDTAGYTNTYLFKPKKSAAATGQSTKGKNELKEINLTDVRLTLDDQKKFKLHDLMVNELASSIDERGDFLLMEIDSDILINSLAFNLRRGSFAKGKFLKETTSFATIKIQSNYLLRILMLRLATILSD